MPNDFNLFIEVCAIISLASIFSWDQLHGNFVNWKANHQQTLKVQKFNCVKSLKVHVKSRKLCRLAINCCRRCQLWGEFTSIVISWKFTNTTSFVFVLSAALQFIAKNLRSETFLIASSVNQKPSTMRLAFLYFALILNFDWICAIFKDADNENGSYKVGATMMQFPYAVKFSVATIKRRSRATLAAAASFINYGSRRRLIACLALKSLTCSSVTSQTMRIMLCEPPTSSSIPISPPNRNCWTTLRSWNLSDP